ncbi:hypothetical protein J6590_066270 [Homalodisca vitripennis]|nr:hypothetical protein J6590_079355 [Homalodisca vitripennis]KAG8261740.1 hypothetical protein J6590_066270 [Homalodisca vitripennis]
MCILAVDTFTADGTHKCPRRKPVQCCRASRVPRDRTKLGLSWRSVEAVVVLCACVEHLWTVWFARCGTALMSAILHNIVACVRVVVDVLWCLVIISDYNNGSKRPFYIGDKIYSAVSALDWQSLPERLCSRTPASTVLYRTGHSVMNYSFAVVLCVSESVKDIFRLYACRQDSSLLPHLLITTWP